MFVLQVANKKRIANVKVQETAQIGWKAVQTVT